MIIINILGLALIAWIVWWFWLYKPAQTVMQTQPLTIEVKDESILLRRFRWRRIKR